MILVSGVLGGACWCRCFWGPCTGSSFPTPTFAHCYLLLPATRPQSNLSYALAPGQDIMATMDIRHRQYSVDTPIPIDQQQQQQQFVFFFGFFFFVFFNTPRCVSLCFHDVSRNSDGPAGHLHSTNGHPLGMPPPIPVDAHSYYSNAAMVGAPHPHHPDCPNSLNCLPDTNEKPNHILPVIVRSAILGSPKQKLTIREIYKAIENKFPYFRTTEVNWKVSYLHLQH